MYPKACATLAPTIEALPASTKVIAGHWASVRPGYEGLTEFQTILDLVQRRRTYAKLSAFKRQYHRNPNGIASLEPLARALIDVDPVQLFAVTAIKV